MTNTLTTILRDQLARERARQEAAADLPGRLAALSDQIRDAYDTRPVSREEWDEACGEPLDTYASSPKIKSGRQRAP